MLEVGNGMSAAEDRTHFVMWSMLASPLILGNDIRKMSKELHELIRQHYLYTGSKLARTMLDDWNRYVEDFIQVVPIEYKRVLQEEQVRKLQQKIADMQRDY